MEINPNGIYLIQGVFFQSKQFLGIGFDELIGERVFSTDGIFHTVFMGVINFDENFGQMNDVYGNSSLRVLNISGSGFSFQKEYDDRRRKDIITYTFVFDEAGKDYKGIWSLRLEDFSDGGVTRCVLTEIDEKKFFDPMEILDFVKENSSVFAKQIQEMNSDTEDDLPF